MKPSPNQTFKKPSRLVIPNENSKDQRWFIKYWPYNVLYNEHVLRRYYKIPEAETKEERIRIADNICLSIDQQLKSGHFYDPRPDGSSDQPAKIMILLDMYLKQKGYMRPRSLQVTTAAVLKFKKYLNEAGLTYSLINQFKPEHAHGYLDYLMSKKLSNRTVNNEISHIRTFFNHTIDRLPDIINRNPFKVVKKLKTSVGRNLAFLPNQVTELIEYQSKYPDMDFLVKFMYYTLMRTNEIANLKVKHIGMFDPNKIYLDKSISKNGYERHVVIAPALKDMIIRRKILQQDPEHYIFSLSKLKKTNKRRMFQPGPELIRSVRFGERYRRWVLDKLNYTKDYTFYSWKHTGVINAKMNGVPDADIMQQTGHKNMESYNHYLKSLGLFATGEYANRVPEI